MSSKSIKDISEKNREVNIHLFRFAKFLRYLKESNAEIKTVDPINGETIIYDNSSEGPSFENLVTIALDIEDEYARDLLSRKLSLSDKQSNKERIRGLGDTVYGITVDMAKGESIDQPSTPIRDVSFQYYRRKDYRKTDRIDLSGMSVRVLSERNKQSEYTVPSRLKHILQRHLNTLISGFVSEKDIISHVVGVDFVQFPILEQPIQQLKSYLNEKNQNTKHNEAQFQLKRKLLSLARVYNQVLDRHDVQNSIIPYYRDFAILSHKDLIEISIDQFFNYSPEDLFEAPESIPQEEVIYYRYEILHLLSGSDRVVSSWPYRFQALLMLCNYELESVHVLLKEVMIEELSNIRFTVLTKSFYNDKRVQKSNLTLDRLMAVLSDYNINEPLDDAFILRDNQILTTALHKYPEKYAVNYNYSSMEVREKLNGILKNYLTKKLFEGLRITEKLLPLNRESSILL